MLFTVWYHSAIVNEWVGVVNCGCCSFRSFLHISERAREREREKERGERGRVGWGAGQLTQVLTRCILGGVARGSYLLVTGEGLRVAVKELECAHPAVPPDV